MDATYSALQNYWQALLNMEKTGCEKMSLLFIRLVFSNVILI